MLNLRKITYFLLISMLFWPLMSYITFGLLGLRSISFYYTFIAIFYGILFIFHKKKIKVPKELYYLIFFIIFEFVWAFFNGDIIRRGIIAVLFDNPSIATFFIVLIIYNTRFSDRFFKKAIFIFKITIILAAIVSIIQFFFPRFLNAYILYRENFDFFKRGIYQQPRTSIFGYIDLNSLGLSFMSIVALISGYLLYIKKRIFLIFLFLGGLTAFLSNARYVMVAFIIISIQYIFYKKVFFKGAFKYAILVLVLLLALYGVFSYLGYDYEAWFNNRLFAEGSIKETTRFKAIGNFLILFPKYYLVGNGGKIYSDEIVSLSRAVGSSHIHVGYLSHLVSYGIVGCFFLYGFWFILVKKLYRKAKQTNYWGSFFAFLTFLWAFATFSYSSIFFYGLIFALVFDKYYSDIYISNSYK